MVGKKHQINVKSVLTLFVGLWLGLPLGVLLLRCLVLGWWYVLLCVLIIWLVLVLWVWLLLGLELRLWLLLGLLLGLWLGIGLDLSSLQNLGLGMWLWRGMWLGLGLVLVLGLWQWKPWKKLRIERRSNSFKARLLARILPEEYRADLNSLRYRWIVKQKLPKWLVNIRTYLFLLVVFKGWLQIKFESIFLPNNRSS